MISRIDLLEILGGECLQYHFVHGMGQRGEGDLRGNYVSEGSSNDPVRTFWSLLWKSNVVDRESLPALSDELSHLPTPKDVAKELVARDIITRWQASELLAGRNAFFLGKYKLHSCVGAGGNAIVYKAHHPLLQRFVALKVIRPALLSDPESVERFQIEIQAVAALQHQNIVAAFDADQVGKTHFLVMEYVDGFDLDSWARTKGALPVATACECIHQAALGLAHIHEKQLVHRDLKPSNLLVSRQPDNKFMVKILDVGLARFVSDQASDEEEDERLTQRGQIIGTLDYMAPEQIEDVQAADIRADIFSLGCTLFKLLTGKVPFGGGTMTQKITSKLMGKAPPARSLRADIPEAIDQIISRCLARDPNHRYQTPADLAQALLPYSLFAMEMSVHSLAVRLPPDQLSSTSASSLRVGGNSDVMGSGTPSSTVNTATDSGPLGSAGTTGGLSGENIFGAGPDPVRNPAPNQPDGAEGPRSDTVRMGGLDTPAPSITGPGQASFHLQDVLNQGTSDSSIQTGGPGSSVNASSVSLNRRKKSEHGHLLISGLVALVVILLGVGYWFYLQSQPGRLVLALDGIPANQISVQQDGQPVEISHEGVVLVPGAVTSHQFVFTRPDFLPITRELEIGNASKASLHLDWKLDPAARRRRTLESLSKTVATIRSQPLVPATAVGMRQKLMQQALKWQGTPQWAQVKQLSTQFSTPIDAWAAKATPLDQTQYPADLGQSQLIASAGHSWLCQWNSIYGLFFAPNNKWVAGRSRADLVIWDMENKKRLFQVFADANTGLVVDAHFLDNNIIIIAFENMVRKYQIDNHTALWEVTPTDEEIGAISAFTLMPTKSQLLVGTKKGQLLLLNVSDGKTQKTVAGHERDIRNLVVDQSSTLCVSTSQKTVKCWKLPEFTQQSSFDEDRKIRRIALRPDGKELALATEGKAISRWKMPKGEHLGDINNLDAIHVYYAKPNQPLLLTGTRGGVFQIDAREDDSIPELQVKLDATQFCLNHDQTLLAATANHQAFFRVYQYPTGEPADVLKGDLAPQGSMRAVDFTGFGQNMIAVNRTGAAWLWSPTSKKPLHQLATRTNELFQGLTTHPPSARFALARRNNQGPLIYNGLYGKETRSFGDSDHGLGYLTFDQSGQEIYGTYHQGNKPKTTVNVSYDFNSKSPYPNNSPAFNGAFGGLIFSPDNKWWAQVDDGKKMLRVGERKSHQSKVYPIKDVGRVQHAQFHPDGQILCLLVSGHHNQPMEFLLFDLQSRTWKKHCDAPHGHDFRFFNLGKQVAVRQHGNTIHFMDWKTGTIADKSWTLGPHGGQVHRLEFSWDGQYAVTANANGSLWLIRLSPK